MGVTIKPVSEIKAKLKLDGRAQSFFTEACYRYMDSYVPKREGNLRTVVSVQDKYITYESPYAKYQYYGRRKDGSHKVRKYTTPGTGPYWDKRMVSIDMDRIIKEVKDYIDNGG